MRKSKSLCWRIASGLTAVAMSSVHALSVTSRVIASSPPLYLSQSSQSDVTNPQIPELILVQPSSDIPQIPRPNFDQQASVSDLQQAFEAYQSLAFSQHFGFKLFGDIASPAKVTAALDRLARQTRHRTAIINVISTGEQLQLVVNFPSEPEGAASSISPLQRRLATVTPSPGFLAQALPANPAPISNPLLVTQAVSAKTIARAAKEFRTEVSDPKKVKTTSYLTSSQQLYRWLIAPIEPALKAKQIDTLVFTLDNGLRSIPIAALHDGSNFLVEQYNLALIPSFSLTDTSYMPLAGVKMLGMGISEATEGQVPLPAVAVEVPTLTNQIWQGQPILNQQATLENLKKLTSDGQFKILHLATHAEFQRGAVNNSYIQLWNSRLKLGSLRTVSLESGWNPNLDLLVLSACQTALGDNQAELGFAGLAVQSGVKTALGSLWRVSDEGSLTLITSFYEQLKTSTTRSEALRKAQLAMLSGESRIQNGQLILGEQLQVSLPPSLSTIATEKFTHPYFWSAFTMVGNWN